MVRSRHRPPTPLEENKRLPEPAIHHFRLPISSTVPKLCQNLLQFGFTVPKSMSRSLARRLILASASRFI
jgi:hypothetical protein